MTSKLPSGHVPTLAVITLFPQLFVQGPLQISLVGKALEEGKWRLKVVDLRTHGLGRHATVDDTPYGGGAGMLLRPDVVHNALTEAVEGLVNPAIVVPSPRGTPLKQSTLWQWAQAPQDKVFLCGRYEGIDQRVLDHWKVEEISVGDFVVCGGDVPAMLIMEGYIRLLDHVVGKEASLHTESFQQDLLEHPHYTRPERWKDYAVPEVLLSGHHARIEAWRQEESHNITQKNRPDLWEKHGQHDKRPL